MAGSYVQTIDTQGRIGVITITAVADISDASFPAEALDFKISGRLIALETDPGATAPTVNYDIDLDDAHAHDVLETVGQNRSDTATEKVAIIFSGTEIHPPVAATDVLTLAITGNSVNAAIIVVKIYFEGNKI